MSDLLKNAISFFQKRYPHATVLNNVTTFRIAAAPSGGRALPEEFVAWPLIAQDPDTGVKHRLIAVENLGLNRFGMTAVAQKAEAVLNELDKNILVGFSHAVRPNPIDTTQMEFAPKVTIYTNAVHVAYSDVIAEFRKADLMIELVNESELYQSLFVSYGGTDAKEAGEINAYLRGKGIKTWFFPEDALPGQKLHRVMHEEINKHDRVLLICSEAALRRPGVLNELERVLEREAKEGGSGVLIPITLDNFVYGDWAPEREDLAAQVRSRVITNIDRQSDGKLDGKQLEKLLKALSR
jgi:hypothetical protein